MTVGPEFLKEDFSSVFGSEGEFSEAITLSWKGDVFPVSGIFDETFQEYDADGNEVLSEFSRVTFERNILEDIVGEIPTTTEEEPTFTMTIRSEVFNVYAPEDDGTGLKLFNLKILKT